MAKKYIMTKSSSGSLVSMDIEDYKNLVNSRSVNIVNTYASNTAKVKTCKGCNKRKK